MDGYSVVQSWVIVLSTVAVIVAVVLAVLGGDGR